jgi:hypothetical protein
MLKHDLLFAATDLLFLAMLRGSCAVRNFDLPNAR